MSTVSSRAQNGTLQDLMEQRSNCPLPEGRLIQLMISLCRGLNAMHTASTSPLAHRDVKVMFTVLPRGSDTSLASIYLPQPANLLLTDSRDELVLMDLGSAAPASVTVSNRSVASSASHHGVTSLLQAGSTGIAGGMCPDLHCSVQVSLSVHFVLY